PEQRAIRPGCLSTLAFQILRAWSYPESAGWMMDPWNPLLNNSTVALSSAAPLRCVSRRFPMSPPTDALRFTSYLRNSMLKVNSIQRSLRIASRPDGPFRGIGIGARFYLADGTRHRAQRRVGRSGAGREVELEP